MLGAATGGHSVLSPLRQPVSVERLCRCDSRYPANLDLFSFVDKHSQREDFVWNFQQFRPYVLMMNTRAKASLLLNESKFTEAMREIESGRDAIVEFFQQSNFPELASKSSEVAFLEEWLAEVSEKRPRSKLELMQREMETAIAKELYERAADLRDAIKMLKASK